MFKFLKLRNSVFGDARRHVPFASIIHKPFFLLFAFLFSFVCIVPVKVKALADPVPQFDVINGTNLQTFVGGYTSAGSDIQAITNMLIGAQVLEYGGLGDYAIRFDQLPDDASVWDRLVLIGEKVTDDLMSPYLAADKAFTKVIDFCQGALNYAKGFASKVEFFNHVNSLQNFYLNYSPDFGYELNQFFANNGGLYNWQNSNKVFNPGLFNFDYQTYNMSASVSTQYFSYLDQMNNPVRFNDRTVVTSPPSGHAYNIMVSSNFFDVYHNLFINTHNNTVYLCDDNGNAAPSSYNCKLLYYWFAGYNNFQNYSFTVKTLSLSNYNSVSDLFNAINFNPLILISCADSFYPALSDFLRNLYMGDTWDQRVDWSEDYDLGFANTDSLEVLNPKQDTDLLFDIKALVQQIVEAEPDPNYELPLQPIIYNVTEVNGSPLTAQDLEGLSFNVNLPESGIEVPINAFVPMFDNGKGFISYMWYMTKPLISYTRSLLDVLTFDPVNGFNASGPGYFVLGVAGLGLIGGVIVKFLL